MSFREHLQDICQGVDGALVKHEQNCAGIGGANLIVFVNLELPHASHRIVIRYFCEIAVRRWSRKSPCDLSWLTNFSRSLNC